MARANTLAYYDAAKIIAIIHMFFNVNDFNSSLIFVGISLCVWRCGVRAYLVTVDY
jgi:hypothetical protein